MAKSAEAYFKAYACVFTVFVVCDIRIHRVALYGSRSYSLNLRKRNATLWSPEIVSVISKSNALVMFSGKPLYNRHASDAAFTSCCPHFETDLRKLENLWIHCVRWKGIYWSSVLKTSLGNITMVTASIDRRFGVFLIIYWFVYIISGIFWKVANNWNFIAQICESSKALAYTVVHPVNVSFLGVSGLFYTIYRKFRNGDWADISLHLCHCKYGPTCRYFTNVQLSKYKLFHGLKVKKKRGLWRN